jgi:hypothetical protein
LDKRDQQRAITHWTVSHGLFGYLPMGDDTFAFLSWSDARDALIADMRDYADTDDDATWDVLTMGPATDYPTHEDGSPDYGDDAPTMLATVDAMIADNFIAPTPNYQWSGWVEDGSGRTIFFALTSHQPSECDDTCELPES